MLAVLPKHLQPKLVEMVPELVAEEEHTEAAGALLSWLEEASPEGPEAQTQLRKPVMSVLGRLHIDPAVAEKVLKAAIEVCL